MVRRGGSDSKLKRIKSVERKIEQKNADRVFFIKEKPNTLNQDWRGVIKELDDSIKQLNQQLITLKKTSSKSKSKDKSASTRKSINAIKELKQTKKFLMDMKENVSDIDKDLIKNKEILKRKITKLNKDVDESIKSLEEIRKLRPDVDLSVYLRDLEISIKKAKEIDDIIKDTDKKPKSKPKSKSKSKSKSKPKSKPKSKSKPKYHPNLEYGDWSQVIYELQQRHPSLGDIPLTWYQANPDGNCFFISVDAVLRTDRNVYNVYKKSAKMLRKRLVSSMNSLLGENAGIAYEMNSQLPPDFGRLSVAPSSVTQTLLENYKRYMSQDSSWAGQLELTMTSKLLNRPIIVFYNNSNPPTIIWHDERHQCPYRNNSQLRGEPLPIILGHVPKSGTGGGIHYIYALYELTGSIKKKKKKKDKITKKRKLKEKRTKRKI